MPSGNPGMQRQPWTDAELAIVRELYPHVKTETIGLQLGRTKLAVYQAAQKLGVKKSAEFQRQLLMEEGERLRIAGVHSRFEKGHPPANKRLRRPGWGPGRMKETQFKKGQRGSKRTMMHKCAADGCKKEIPVALLMCRRHWKLVPRRIQRAVWRTVNDSDRNRYYAHVTDAIRAVARAEGTQLELVS